MTARVNSTEEIVIVSTLGQLFKPTAQRISMDNYDPSTWWEVPLG